MKKFAFFLFFIVLTLFTITNLYIFERFKLKRSLLYNIKLFGPPKIPKFFCIILTQNKSESYLRQKAVYNTWGKKCDNYKFIMTIPDELNGNLDMSNVDANKGIEFIFNNNSFLQPPGYINDTYNTLNEKVFMAFKYLYNKYSDYDWYLKADDDTFILTENLRNFISDKNASLPVTYGYDFKTYVEKGYHSGGAGYLLSNEAFKRLGKKLNGKRDWDYVGAEDVDIGILLRSLGVFPNKSLDDNARERFHPFDIRDSFYVNTLVPFYNSIIMIQILKTYLFNKGVGYDWYLNYASNPIRIKYDCCSESSISFHYIYAKDIEKLEELAVKYSSNVTKIIKEHLNLQE